MKKLGAIIFEKGFIVGLCIIAIMLLGYGLSWIITCGLVKLITICFGLEFSWKIATGIWLVFVLIKTFFGKSSSSDK